MPNAINKRAVWGCVAAAMFISTGLSLPRVAAQDEPAFDVIPVNKLFFSEDKDDKKQVTTFKKQVEAILFGTNPFGEAEKAKLRNWYGLYQIPIMSYPSKFSEIPEIRAEFFKNMARVKDSEVHDYVINVVLSTLSVIVDGVTPDRSGQMNYHPAARYNAMYFIGRLNTAEPIPVGLKKQLPVPNMPALNYMIRQYMDKKQMPAIRVAALTGIQRHIELDRFQQLGNRRINGNLQAGLIDVLSKLAQAKDPDPGVSLGGHNWMRRQAVDSLAGLRNFPQCFGPLEAVALDAEAPIKVRVAAARGLGQLEYPQMAPNNVNRIARAIVTAATHACQLEVRKMQSMLKQEEEEDENKRVTQTLLTSGGTGQARPKKADPDFDARSYRVALVQRRVKSDMVRAKAGLKGVPKDPSILGIARLLADGPPKAYVNKVIEKLDEIIAVTDKEDYKTTKALLADLAVKATGMEDACKVAVKLPPMKEEASGPNPQLPGSQVAAPNGLPTLPTLPGTEPKPGPTPTPKPDATPKPGPATPAKPAGPPKTPAKGPVTFPKDPF